MYFFLLALPAMFLRLVKKQDAEFLPSFFSSPSNHCIFCAMCLGQGSLFELAAFSLDCSSFPSATLFSFCGALINYNPFVFHLSLSGFDSDSVSTFSVSPDQCL